MLNPPPSAQLRPPRQPPATLSRPRLLALMDQVLDGPPIALVSAPAGYGKTTLVLDWFNRLSAARPDVAAVWYTVEPADDNAHQFLSYLVAAARAAAPDALPQSAALLRESISADPETVVAEIVRELSLLSRRLVVVIDDYHLLRAAEVQETVRALIRYRPPALRLIFVARHDPPLALSRLRAGNELLEIRARQLAFTADEAARLMGQPGAAAPDEQTVRALHELTEGWPVGLRLALLSMGRGEQPADFVTQLRQGSHPYIVDYLVEEVLNGLPPDRLHLLESLSSLDQFSPALCAAAMGTDDLVGCRNTLDDLAAQNLFIVALDEERGWYRTQRQFRGVLFGRYQQRTDAAARNAMTHRVAAWYESQAMLEEAVAAYLAAGDDERAAAVIRAHATELENDDQWARLGRLLARLPESQIEADAGLLLPRLWHGLLTLDTTPMAARLERLGQLLADRGISEQDDPATWGELYALRGSALNIGPSPAERRADLLRALGLVPRSHSWARAYVFAALVYAMSDPDQSPMIERMIRDELAQQGVEGIYRIRLLQALGLIYFRTGSLDAYESTSRRYLRLSEELGRVSNAAYAHFGIGIARFYRGERLAAQPELEAALAHPGLVGREMLYTAMYPLLTIYAETDQQARIEPALAQADRILSFGPNREEWSALEAFAALLLGRQDEARRWADETHHTPAGLPVEARALVLARVRLAMPEPAGLAQADELLAAYIAALAGQNEARRRLQALVLRARVVWLRGRADEALDLLEQAIALGYGRGYRCWFLEPGPELGEMLLALARAGRQAEAARQLLPARPADERQAVFGLSPREHELLRLLGQGLSNKEIAAALVLSPNTVRNQLAALFTKLGVSSRAEALDEARLLGWVD